MASGGLDATVRIWDIGTGKIRRRLIGPNNWVLSVAFSPDGQTLASGGTDGIVLWDVSTSEVRQRIGDQDSVSSVAFSPNGNTLASMGYGSSIHLYDVNTGESRQTFTEHSGEISMVLYSPDGQTLASQVEDSIRIWDVGTGKIRHTFTGTLGAFAFSPESQMLAGQVWQENSIYLWDVNTGKIRHTLPIKEDESVGGIAFSPKGQTLITIGLDRMHKGSLHLWDVGRGEIRETRPIENAEFFFSTWPVLSPDGQTLASAGSDNRIGIWDVGTGRILQTLIGHKDSVTSVAFSPDGETLASGSLDATVRIWDVGRGEIRHTLRGHSDWVLSVAFSPNAKTLASGGRTIHLWDVKAGEHRHALTAYDTITSLSFSPDGQTLAGGGFQGTMQLWDASSVPLPVSLSSFKASQTSGGVIVNWMTESELNNAGFNILRGLSKQAEFVKVNPRLIPGAGTTSERNTYSWTETTAKPNIVYYYRIEDVSYAGERQELATVRLRGLVSAGNKRLTLWGELKRNQ